MSGEAKRVHYEVTSTGIEVAVYSDGDIVLRAPDRTSVIFEPPQIRKLSHMLAQLPDSTAKRVSLGDDRSGEEARFRWDGSKATLSDPYSSISLTIDGIVDLENTLGQLGY